MAEEQQKTKTAVELYREQVKTEAQVVRNGLEKLREQFQMALPAHIPVERFERVVMTTVQNNPDLITKCTRESLFGACVKAAQDGLLPDGREGAIVPMGSVATWLPMIFGIRKKVRNSGEILDWDVQLVYSNDQFEYELGTSKFIRHKPFMGLGDTRGDLVGGYSIADLKGGGVSIELMRRDEIEAVRKKASRAKSADSPWNVPEYYGEMCRKTIARRHSKMLPMSSDLDDLMRRDDHLYAEDNADAPKPRRHQLGSALDALAGPQGGGDAQTGTETTTADADGVVQDDKQSGNGMAANGASDSAGKADAASEGKPAQQTPADPQPGQKEKQSENPAADNGAASAAKASDKPVSAKASNKPPKIPTTEAEYKVYAKAWIDAVIAEGKSPVMLKERWQSPEEKKIRNAANVSPEARETIFEYLVAAEQKAGGA